VTELIAACGYNNEALGVGPYSFSSALIMELQKLSKRLSFSVGELYSNIYLNIQHRTLMDGTERHPPPIHLPLTQEARFPRSIQLSASRELVRTSASTVACLGDLSASQASLNVTRGSTVSISEKSQRPSALFIPEMNELNDSSSGRVRASRDSMVPRMSFAIRLKDTFRPDELSEDLFKEWLRIVPALVEEVKVEAGFGSFSSLLIVSVPISLSLYIPFDPAVISLGPITTSNLISSSISYGNPKAMGSASSEQTIKCHTLKGHTDSVSAVTFPPDSKLVASASYDKTVKLWDPTTGKMHRTLEGHTYLVSATTFSPDGKLIASASYDKTIRLWDPATGIEHRTLEGHTDWATAVAFSPDGKLIASASYDRTIKLWDPATGTEYRSLEGHKYLVSGIMFSPDGKHIASASYDKTIKLWDLDSATGKEHRTLEGHKSWVTAVAFSPDGKLIASASYDKTVRLWDSGRGLPAMCSALKGHTDWVTAVAFSPDGTRVVSASFDGTIRFWDSVTGLPVAGSTLRGNMGSALAVTFSPDGRFVASGSHDKTIRIWEGILL
jgi:roadblock/LC7 domain-containing protein